MKLKCKDFKLATVISLVTYYVFTIVCVSLSWMFREQRILIFQIWYQVTAAIWLVLAVMVVVLLIKLLRLMKIKNEIEHWKE